MGNCIESAKGWKSRMFINSLFLVLFCLKYLISDVNLFKINRWMVLFYFYNIWGKHFYQKIIIDVKTTMSCYIWLKIPRLALQHLKIAFFSRTNIFWENYYNKLRNANIRYSLYLSPKTYSWQFFFASMKRYLFYWVYYWNIFNFGT